MVGFDRRFEEPRRDFQRPVGLKGVAPARPDVMQSKDCADAAHEEPEPEMAPGKIQGFEPGSNGRLFQTQRLLPVRGRA